jgi:hypothetical protein
MLKQNPQMVQTLWTIIQSAGPEPPPEMLFVTIHASDRPAFHPAVLNQTVCEALADGPPDTELKVLPYVRLDLLPDDLRKQVREAAEAARVGKGRTLACGHFLGITKGAGEEWLVKQGLTFEQWLEAHLATCPQRPGK